MRRRIEIVAFEHERVISRPASAGCPVCYSQSGWLTTAQAAALVQVKASSLYRWLAEGKVHGVKTHDGQHRICKNSLFIH